jgi:hypothetical protein
VIAVRVCPSFRASHPNCPRTSCVDRRLSLVRLFSRAPGMPTVYTGTKFSTASPARLRKQAAQKLTQPETRICNVTLSFESCRL